jgi:uncharacterized membrane protein
MIQTIWNTANGNLLQESVNMGEPMMRFWMAHWEFIYLFVALIYKIFPSVWTILIIHTTVIALGALPVYWLAKDKLKHEIIAVVFAYAYLLYPAMQNANLLDVHGVTFAAPFLLFAFYFLQKRSYGWFAFHAFFAVMSREDSALILIMMAAYAFFIMKERKVGIITGILCAAWFLVWYKRMTIRAMLGLPEFVIMEGAETHWSHLANMKTDSLYLIKFLAKKHNIIYFFNLFGPVFFLSLLSPSTLLIAAPIFAINLLSSYFYTHDVSHHYSATIAPFVFISAIYGAEKILDWMQFKLKDDQKLLILSVIVGIFSLMFFFMSSNTFDAVNWKITDHHKKIKSVIEQVPTDASLTATRKVAVHAAERHELYLFNEHVNSVDYIMYDFYAPTVRLLTRSSFVLPYHWPDNDSIRKVLRNRDYGIVEYTDGICLFEKGANYEAGLQKLALSEGSDINNKKKARLTDQIDFIGFNKHDILKYYIQPDKLGKIYWKHALHFTCFWQSDSVLQDSQAFSFKLKKDDIELNKDHFPVFGVYPITKWQPKDIIRDEIFWELPDDFKTGVYQVHVKIMNQTEENDYVHLFDLNIREL